MHILACSFVNCSFISVVDRCFLECVHPLMARRHYGEAHSYVIELCRLDDRDIERLAMPPDMSILYQ